MTNNPHALAQIAAILGKRIPCARDRQEELAIMKQLARAATRYVVVVTQGERSG